MRPESVVMFERLFLLSLALSAGTLVVGYDDMMRAVLSDPSMRRRAVDSIAHWSRSLARTFKRGKSRENDRIRRIVSLNQIYSG